MKNNQNKALTGQRDFKATCQACNFTRTTYGIVRCPYRISNMRLRSTNTNDNPKKGELV